MLHGEIKVNRSILNEWSAQRIAGSPPGICKYRWKFSNLSGEYTGTLQHDYALGAAALAMRVLEVGRASQDLEDEELKENGVTFEPGCPVGQKNTLIQVLAESGWLD